MAKRILWVSQHTMNGVQMAALRRLYGQDVQVNEIPQTIRAAEDVVRQFRDGGYDDLIVVAPLSVLGRLVDLGVRPLWSNAEIVRDPTRADWTTKGRGYRFTGFKRVRALKLEFDSLGPDADRRDSD